MSLTPPETLSSHHSCSDFSCGIASLDDWLKRRAYTNQISGATRTFVICADNRVVGYYALASGAISIQSALGKFRRNMPDPIPVVILARLAIDSSYQSQGLGRALFRDAALRVVQAGDTIGIRGIIVHAISEEAKDFYLALGFILSSLEPMTLMITLNDLRDSIT
ncbi:GNAT family N-acetyltransferase [Dolichospermum sp. LEGE 00240]|jgi:GNAT superfamily N-acetyltransferase|uniref:GNAT family N-acetyltransferase n=1 Tax=Dolichospermum sp. LEGE 00240 TaxID=1828603 RepID=UPI001880FB1B|nr:GNAT family N-acetyltransferase [Dolichospermum sp. LEGE 00240]MBE9252019.1 GNAT family N-acetyltransferase [Dolichospermum sp. LEGE 00240]MDM3848456.1 GNAT family N-acetyltransferase [Aphanizomenon gracile PMC627.10]